MKHLTNVTYKLPLTSENVFYFICCKPYLANAKPRYVVEDFFLEAYVINAGLIIYWWI